MKRTLNLILFPLLLGLTQTADKPESSKFSTSTPYFNAQHKLVDTLDALPGAPSDLSMTSFTGPDLTPSPACLAVAPTGEVYVGVDMIGSLGKDMGKG